MKDDSHTPPRLAYFPVSFFAMTMGLCGLTIGWEQVQGLLHLELKLTPWLLGLTVSLFGLLALIYALKLMLYRAEVMRELHHPVKLSFFPTISVSLLLLAAAVLPVSTAFSKPLWMIGALLHLVLTLYIFGAWIHRAHFQIHHLNPSWFIPAVGNIAVPIAGAPLGYVELSWFFFSVGILFWLVLLVLLFHRLLFHHPLESHLLPTLFILIAPPALGFIAYLGLVGRLDSLGRILYFAGLFLTLMLLTQIRLFLGLRFSLSWWAYLFPLAAIAVASLAMFRATQQDPYLQLGTGLVMLSSGLVLLLLVQTMRAIGRHGICVPDQPAGLLAAGPSPHRALPWLSALWLGALFILGVWLAVRLG